MEKNKVYEGKYFCIYQTDVKNRKTPIYDIFSLDDINLGQIRWYAAWRKFCFYPNGDTIWDDKCLRELYEVICIYNDRWKGKTNV